ncbi:MAG: WYL domain-containing protein [Desulfobacula sp.]|jgi:predicted DNA-binding transcriptional regulator YafY|nr:WYL domain-containing protein [Desulfobacula sp.]
MKVNESLRGYQRHQGISIFTTSSESELITWILSFGNEAKVLKPVRLIGEVKENIKSMQSIYE